VINFILPMNESVAAIKTIAIIILIIPLSLLIGIIWQKINAIIIHLKLLKKQIETIENKLETLSDKLNTINNLDNDARNRIRARIDTIEADIISLKRKF